MLSLCLIALQNPEDESRFEKFYNMYYDTIYYFAKEHLKTKEAAEDCAQEVLIHFAKNFHKITQDIESKQFRNYVIVVSKGIAVDMYRKERRHLNNVVDADLTEFFNVCEEEEFDSCDMMLLTDAINALPEKNKLVFYLKYIYGMSAIEISNSINMTEPMVRKRCMQSMQFVKKYVKGAESDE
ncbi:MAG: sigma-70 family RNA polymerase sigma factor [Clostridia bacterium]|nr:sigma-70 family RNA polymerase sigma factor [Clostridia bacterium]